MIYSGKYSETIYFIEFKEIPLRSRDPIRILIIQIPEFLLVPTKDIKHLMNLYAFADGFHVHILHYFTGQTMI